MPDIREILNALSPDDKVIWQNARSKMRSTYIGAHGATMGSEQWTEHDDAFLDLIDIKLALLFDGAGKLNAPTEIVSHKDGVATEEAIKAAEDEMKKAVKDYRASPASAMLAQIQPSTPNNW